MVFAMFGTKQGSEFRIGTEPRWFSRDHSDGPVYSRPFAVALWNSATIGLLFPLARQSCRQPGFHADPRCDMDGLEIIDNC